MHEISIFTGTNIYKFHLVPNLLYFQIGLVLSVNQVFMSWSWKLGQSMDKDIVTSLSFWVCRVSLLIPSLSHLESTWITVEARLGCPLISYLFS